MENGGRGRQKWGMYVVPSAATLCHVEWANQISLAVPAVAERFLRMATRLEQKDRYKTNKK